MKLELNNNIDELNKLTLAIEGFCEEHGIEMKDNLNLNLVLEEVFSNIVFYAYGDDESHKIHIELLNKDDEVVIKVKDDGKQFNIMEAPEPDHLSKDISEKKVGGLGIHFVKNLMDNIEYSRKGGFNILVMKKEIKKQ